MAELSLDTIDIHSTHLSFALHGTLHRGGGVEFCEARIGGHKSDSRERGTKAPGGFQLRHQFLHLLAVHRHDAGGAFEQAAEAVARGPGSGVQL